MLHTCYLGIGANLGNREATIQQAIAMLHEHDLVEVVAQSPLIETKAVSPISQPDFLNGALQISTILSPQELLVVLKDIEQQLGRYTKGDYGPRTIDLDIIFYDDEVLSLDDLTVPHPLCHERFFVMQPLMALAPQYLHPILGQTVEQIYSELLT